MERTGGVLVFFVSVGGSYRFKWALNPNGRLFNWYYVTYYSGPGQGSGWIPSGNLDRRKPVGTTSPSKTTVANKIGATVSGVRKSTSDFKTTSSSSKKPITVYRLKLLFDHCKEQLSSGKSTSNCFVAPPLDGETRKLPNGKIAGTVVWINKQHQALLMQRQDAWNGGGTETKVSFGFKQFTKSSSGGSKIQIFFENKLSAEWISGKHDSN